MKKLVQYIIQKRNPAFSFDKELSFMTIAGFTCQYALAVLRGWQVLLFLRKPLWMMRGRSVHFFNLSKIRWGRFTKLGDHVYISALGKGCINLGHNVSIGAFSRLVISTSLNNIGESITIGNNVGIGEFAYLGGAGGLTIEDDCIIGQYLSCHPENHLYEDVHTLIRQQGVSRKGIHIGSNCWIGSKVTILDGVTIGEGCVIAAGAVVTQSFPAFSVIGGVPARQLKKRITPETLKNTA